MQLTNRQTNGSQNSIPAATSGGSNDLTNSNTRLKAIVLNY